MTTRQAPTKMGRPALYDKPLKRTFTLDEETSAIIDAYAEENHCSRSDALVMMVQRYWRGIPRRGGTRG